MRAHKIFIFLLGLLAAITCHAQTDVAASLYGALSTSPQGGNTTQSQSYSAGGLFEFQHRFSPALNFEATYSFNPAKQDYAFIGAIPAVVVCFPSQNNAPPVCSSGGIAPVSVSANAHEFTADWIPSATKGAFRPFAVFGGGVLIDVPSGGQSNTTTDTKPVFVFGLGMDWAHWKRWGLRFQYRGNLDIAPLLTTQYASTGSLMLTNEPMVGIYFRLP